MTPLDSLRHRTGQAPLDESQTGQAEVYYVYVLQSEKDGNFYVGYTGDLKKRMNEHNNGEVKSTSYRRPFLLVYFEGSLNKGDAILREKYLKTAWGKRYIKGRIKGYLSPLDSLRHRTGQAPLDSFRHQTGQVEVRYE